MMAGEREATTVFVETIYVGSSSSICVPPIKGQLSVTFQPTGTSFIIAGGGWSLVPLVASGGSSTASGLFSISPSLVSTFAEGFAIPNSNPFLKIQGPATIWLQCGGATGTMVLMRELGSSPY